MAGAALTLLIVSIGWQVAAATALPEDLPDERATATDAGEVGTDDTPTSTEQGHTQLPDSFKNRPIQSLLSTSDIVGIRDTTFTAELRSFYWDNDNFNHSINQAWTVGGLAGLKSGYFYDLLAIGATAYTSQHLTGPDDRSGTPLLQADQKSYSVIGELYGEFRLSDQVLATVGYRGFSTPYINEQDAIMTPYTYLVYGVQGDVKTTEDSSLRFGAAYVDKIKPRNSEDFESMATAIGAPPGVSRGVDVIGANYKIGAFSIGALEYHSADLINIAYTEIKYAIPLPSGVRLTLNAQYTDQHSAGEDLLTGSPFDTHQYGFKADLSSGGALLTVARTVTAVGTLGSLDSGTSMRSPWGGYPGYTAVQIENFFRAGEDATMLRAAYNFPKSTGLSVYGLWVHGSSPAIFNQYAQQEYDANLQWTASSAKLQGLRLQTRYAHVSQAGPANEHQDQLRLILYYTWR
jgi:hypothetical protein